MWCSFWLTRIFSMQLASLSVMGIQPSWIPTCTGMAGVWSFPKDVLYSHSLLLGHRKGVGAKLQPLSYVLTKVNILTSCTRTLEKPKSPVLRALRARKTGLLGFGAGCEYSYKKSYC